LGPQVFAPGIQADGQSRQFPPLQYLALPQAIPSDLLPLDTHIDVPLAQDVLPVLHRFPPGLSQSRLATQETQLPPLHTLSCSHQVPFGTVFPVTQTCDPVEQEVLPFLQMSQTTSF
jgi:hypothetical protein